MEDKKYEDNVFDCLFYIGLNNSFEKEMNSLPSDEELKKMYPVPKKIPRSIRAKIKKKKYGKPAAVVYLTRIIIGIMVALSLAFTILATDEGVRDAVSQVVLKWFDGYVKVDFKESGTDSLTLNKSYNDFSIYYIPRGFVIENSVENPGMRKYNYNKSGEKIYISIISSEIMDVFVDSETDLTEKITINGLEGIYTEDKDSDGKIRKIIVFGNSKTTIRVISNIEKEEVIKIAENIK